MCVGHSLMFGLANAELTVSEMDVTDEFAAVIVVVIAFILGIAINHATDATITFVGFPLAGLVRVLLLLLVMFAFAGSLLHALGVKYAARAARPVSHRRNGRGAPPAAQEQAIRAPHITLNPWFFGHGFLGNDIGKVLCLLSDEGFFRAVAEHVQLPACADLALDLYAVALGLDVDWRGQVLCEAVRKLSVDVPLDQVVDFAVGIAPASQPVVAVELLQQVQWVLFTHRPLNDAVRTIQADVHTIGSRAGWFPEDMVRVAHASRIAIVLGVAGRQPEIVGAACVILGGMTVEQIVSQYRYNRRAVEDAINQFAERGVLALLRLVAP